MATETSRTESADQSRLVRVTVNLTEKAYKALQQAVELTGRNKTDTINRAIQVNAWVEEVTHAGGNIYVEEKPGADLQRVKIL